VPLNAPALAADAGEPQADLAWVFPGQGSQEVGMGLDLFNRFAEARQVLELADEILDIPLTRICFEGPEEELRQTINQQPAIVAVSMACLAAARGRKASVARPPAMVAGHSLGEYSALIAAGSLSFADGLQLVRERGRLMQVAGDENPGTLAAIIGLDESSLAEVCRGAGAEICNVNTENQIVIGGEREAVLRAMERASAQGARKVVPLNVSAAFHSSLMQPAAEGMAEAIERVEIRDPVVPVVGNCSGRPLSTADSIKQELIEQVSTAVQWRQSIQEMLGAGISIFVEIGPGRVLSGLIRQIDRSASLINISKLADIESGQEA
jgi:[acyl-carrier-protein] S-malonyltransferase